MSFVRRTALAATLVAGVLSGFALAGRAQDGAKPAAPPKPAAPAAQDAKKSDVIVPFFGNEKCPATGKAVNHDQSVEIDGQKVYFCCKNCVAKAKAASKAEQTAMAATAYKEVKAVGNKTCPVSGHAIDATKGKEMTWQGHKVTLCCADCVKAFEKEPMVATAIATYGCKDLKNAKCPVQEKEASNGEDLVIYKGQLIRMCCDDCPKEFTKDADKYLKAAGGK